MSPHNQMILGPDKEGWWDVTEEPNFSPIVKGEINVLQEMRPVDGWKYIDTKGKTLFVTMYRYPAGAVTKFTQYKGTLKKDPATKATIDTRKYKTPFEGVKNNCFISYYIEDGFDYDIDNNPIQLYKHLQCLPSQFAKKVGWKKGDGLLKGEVIPDTTPKADKNKQAEEIKKVNKEKIEKEVLEKAKK